VVFRESLVDGICQIAYLPEGRFVASQFQKVLKTSCVDRPGEFCFVALRQGVFGFVVRDTGNQQLTEVFERFDAHLVDRGIVGHDDVFFGAFDIFRRKRRLLFQLLEGIAGAFDAETRHAVTCEFLKHGAADTLNVEGVDQMFEGAGVLELVADAVDQLSVFLAAAVALVEALPAGADGMGAYLQWRVVKKCDFHAHPFLVKFSWNAEIIIQNRIKAPLMKCTDRFYPVISDFRDPFARDRDRVIHTSSFRRLEYKTQVFINHDGDYFRTRLTHSLEVSQIARAIANALDCHETLAETIALAHDLGHTPFGHVGGDTLDRCLKDGGNENGFEHNFQSFRIVTKLEKRYAPFDGLNLTFATLEGILKHSYPYKKPFLSGWYDEVFGLDYHPSLEAMIVDCADEIAYISHDIDDGIQYGLISFEDILENELVAYIDEKVRAEGLERGTKLHRYRFVGMLISHLVTELIASSRPNLPKHDTILCRTIPASEPVPIAFEKALATQIKRLKKMLFDKLYRHERIVSKMHAGKECIKKLYAALTEDINLLPKAYKVRLEAEKMERVVADFIAGMSDRYALMRYREIYGLE